LLSPADMVIIGAAALIFFGPDQLPKVARRAGQAIRDVQNTSQSFIREMERAADAADYHPEPEDMSPHYEYRSYAEPTPAAEPLVHDPAPAAHPPSEPAAAPVKTVGEPGRAGIAHEDASGI
jgi:Sec-independent protein translocase protein TatA